MVMSDDGHDVLVDNDVMNSNVEIKIMKKGLSVPVAAVFIVGTMCGSGILALPQAIVNSGWAGIPLLILCGLLSSYTGSILGNCWSLLRKRYPEYEHEHITDPYPTIGLRAAGKWGRRVTRISITLTLFGTATVFLLLIAGNISNLVKNLDHNEFHTCFLVLIVGAFLIPLTWLGTPKDFWQAGIIAAITTTIGAILIIAGLAEMAPNQPSITHANPSFDGFFKAFGTILFAFGGASVFPSIQVDMKNPNKFPISVVIGLTSVLALYLPVSLSGFIVIGDLMTHSNILDEMDGGWILYTVIILITSHLLMAFLIVVNPVNQDLEGFLGIEDKFSWKRCVLRTSVMLGLVFLALTIPHFGVILSLVGGTTVTATNFVFPPLFYLLLSRQEAPEDAYGDLPLKYRRTLYTAVSHTSKVFSEQEGENTGPLPPSESSSADVANAILWPQLSIPLHIKVLLCEIIIIGIVGGIASTYSIITSLVDGSSGFTVPCYVNWATGDA